MVTTVEEARTVVGELEAKLASAEASAAELQTERRRISFAANTGDEAARKALDKLNKEGATAGLEAENIKSAIEEARRRLSAAIRDEAMAKAREDAAAAMIIGDRLVERAAKIDAALALASGELAAYKGDLDALHLRGCAAPTAQQFLTFGGLAMASFLTRLQIEVSSAFRVDRDFLGPRERRNWSEMSTGWRDGVAHWAERFLGEKSEAADG